jgi:NADH-quinone oxidoreductase subunit C
MELNSEQIAREYETILRVLKERYESELLYEERVDEFLSIGLRREKASEIIRFLYFNDETQLRFLTTLCGIHYPERGEIAVMYMLHNLVTNARVRIKIFLPVGEPVTNTITDTFAGANWMERETYDFFGVIFTGHPDLRRILNVDDMIIFPMRKEYPLEDQTREDKQDSMFGR